MSEDLAYLLEYENNLRDQGISEEEIAKLVLNYVK